MLRRTGWRVGLKPTNQDIEALVEQFKYRAKDAVTPDEWLLMNCKMVASQREHSIQVGSLLLRCAALLVATLRSTARYPTPLFCLAMPCTVPSAKLRLTPLRPTPVHVAHAHRLFSVLWHGRRRASPK